MYKAGFQFFELQHAFVTEARKSVAHAHGKLSAAQEAEQALARKIMGFFLDELLNKSASKP
jgi:hypothetical protein